MRTAFDLPLLVWVAAGFAAGIALAGARPPALALAASAVLAGAAVWGLLVAPRRPLVRAAGCLLLAAVFGAAHTLLDAARRPLWPVAVAGRSVIVRGAVHDPPEVTATGWRMVVRLRRLAVSPDAPPHPQGRGARSRPPPSAPHDERVAAGLVRVTGRGRPPHALPGDQVVVRGRFRLGRPAGNPGERSEQDGLRRRGLAGVVHTGTGGVDVVRPGGWSLRRLLAVGRQRLIERALRALPPPQGGLLLSLLLGIDTHLPPDLYRQFTRAGLVHLMVVSGAQVAIVAGACAWAARLARLSVPAAAAVSAATLALFVALTGWAPSIGRAAIMAAVGLGAGVLGRPRDPAATLAAAALVLLVLSPALLRDIGFQLSFAATWGLLYVAPALRRGLAWAGAVPAAALSVTLGAQVAVAPLLAAHFQVVPVAGVVANVLVLPLIAVLVPAGFALLPAVILAPAAGDALLGLLRPGLAAVLWLGTMFGDLSWATVPTPPVSATAAAACLVAIGIAVRVGGGAWRPARAVRLALAGAAVVGATVWYAAAVEPPRELLVTVLDVGQGDAILLQSPSGRAALVDGGGEVGTLRTGWDVGLRRVVPALRRAGVRRLDAVVLTHPHEDHVGGLPAVVENFPVGLVLDPGLPHPSPSYARLLRAVQARRLPYRVARAGLVLDLGAGVRLTVVYPPEPIPVLEGDPVHAGSVVARVVYGRTAILLTGDAETPAERYLIDHGAVVAAGALKVGHHGSRTSTAPEFVARVRPKVAVISAGADNLFGHPHPRTLQTLAEAGVTVYRTDRDGAVRLASDGLRWTVSTARRPADARIR